MFTRTREAIKLSKSSEPPEEPSPAFAFASLPVKVDYPQLSTL